MVYPHDWFVIGLRPEGFADLRLLQPRLLPQPTAADLIMLSVLRSSRGLVQQASRRRMSSLLESDTGVLGTRIHHHISTGLTIFTPLYFLTPDSYTDGAISRTFGMLLSISISVHSWIGLNYVIRDYVPKVSYALLRPARIANLGLSAITLVGMCMISLSSPGGLKGVVKGVWNGDRTPKDTEPKYSV